MMSSDAYPMLMHFPNLKSLLLLVILISPVFAIAKPVDKMSFWRRSPHGANMFSENPESDFIAAYQYGIRLVRFGATGSPGDLRYLVKGDDPNDRWNLSETNIGKLKHSISKATSNGLKVVITLAHLPGRAWEYRQRDYRIWENDGYRDSFVRAWQKLADELKGNPNIVGYDLFNEPYMPPGEEGGAKLWQLYRESIAAIRIVDADTPIIIESPAMAALSTIPSMPVFEDQKVIYSFHYYEPFPYFSPPLNQGRWQYPGLIPRSEGEVPTLWNKDTHRHQFTVARKWQVQNNIESYRIFVGEFGAWRKAKGVKAYLRDVTEIFSNFGWSWTYYAFREDDWDVADLELENPGSARRETSIFRILREQFR